VKTAVFVLSALMVAPALAQRGGPPAPPATETVTPAIPGVVAAGTKVAIVKDGFRSSEGPVAMPDGSVLFTEPGASKVHKIDKDGTMSVFLENTGNANGLALDSKGRLIATTALTVEVLYPENAKAVLAKEESRPNDLVVDKKDGVYYTLPSHKPSAVYYIPAGGKPMLVGEVRSPHGVQLSPDEKTLYVGDSNGAYLVSFDVQPDGKLTNKRNFGKYDGIEAGEGGAGPSHADGIAVDSEGRVYVGIEPGVQIFDKAGKYLGMIPVSQRPQNLAFGGPDKKTLYLTGRSALFAVKTQATGYKGRAK
jgi:gluconolactonase